MGRKIMLLGRVFGRLTVISPSDNRGKQTTWLCLCECGNRSIVMTANLLHGHAWPTRSCGCLIRESAVERLTKHGQCDSTEYAVWKEMRRRTNATNGRRYQYYASRGITMCDRWEEFSNFLADMGKRPSQRHSLDRYPNNHGNYEPGNCRWATQTEQSRNKNNNLLITFCGETRCLAEWCDRLNLGYSKTYKRLTESGWSPERAFS